MKVAVTGHRPNKLGGYELTPLRLKISQKIYSILEKLKVDVAYTGMALGIDQDFARVCKMLNIPYIACVPCDDQDRMWPLGSKDLYSHLLSSASEIIVVTPGRYKPWVMQKRNEYMVNQLNDKDDFLLAVWDGSSGGTANCVKYAEKLKKTIVRIDPKDYL